MHCQLMLLLKLRRQELSYETERITAADAMLLGADYTRIIYCRFTLNHFWNDF